MNLRLVRFDRSKVELASKKGFKTQFTAAMCMELDGELLLEFLKKNEKPKIDSLAQSGLSEKIEKALKNSRKKHGELAEKARLFRNGLHYWLRGRYGAGAEVFGLMKLPSAMDSELEMQALYMPRKRPMPISAYHKASSNGYERRHLLTWAAEFLPVVEAMGGYGNTQLTKGGIDDNVLSSGMNPAIVSVPSDDNSKASARTAFGKQFPDSGFSIPYQLVGSYEYIKAIDYINRLARKSTAAEIKVYDSLIASQKEFSFYCGIATDYGLRKIDDLDEDERGLIESTYKRQTLAWLLALARVEVGATVSMYGESDDPFGQIGMSKFGVKEYTEILLDDLSAHLKAMEQDQRFQKATTARRISGETFAYLRRARLVNDLLGKVLLTNNKELIAAAEPYVRSIENYIDRVVRRVEKALRPSFAINSGTEGSGSPEIGPELESGSSRIESVSRNRQRLYECAAPQNSGGSGRRGGPLDGFGGLGR